MRQSHALGGGGGHGLGLEGDGGHRQGDRDRHHDRIAAIGAGIGQRAGHGRAAIEGVGLDIEAGRRCGGEGHQGVEHGPARGGCDRALIDGGGVGGVGGIEGWILIERMPTAARGDEDAEHEQAHDTHPSYVPVTSPGVVAPISEASTTGGAALARAASDVTRSIAA